jgi:hypothetical protein
VRALLERDAFQNISYTQLAFRMMVSRALLGLFIRVADGKKKMSMQLPASSSVMNVAEKYTKPASFQSDKI